MTYDRNGCTLAMVPIGALRESEIAVIQTTIENELVTSGPSLVAHGILFANVATHGWVRYGDRFQILPVPPHAPRPPQPIGLHPFQIEVRFTSSANNIATFARRAKALREYELLCAAFLATNIRSVGNNSAMFHWVLENPGAAEMRVSHRQELYTWDGFTPVEADFTSTDGIPTMPSCEPQLYYTRQGYSVDSQLDVPSTFHSALSKYFMLHEDLRRQFRRAAYWYQFAKETWARSRSAALVAFVSAIEALKDSAEEKSQACSSCGQRIGTGATARFVELLDRLAPVGAIPTENRRTYYGLRSALAHGDKLLQDDLSIWPMGPASMEEGRELRALAQIVQIVLYNSMMRTGPSAL